MAEKIKCNIHFPPDMLAALKKLAHARDVSYAEIVRQACRAFIVANAADILQERRAMESVK